jgi:hypothetical protein
MIIRATTNLLRKADTMSDLYTIVCRDVDDDVVVPASVAQVIARVDYTHLGTKLPGSYR